MPVIAQGKKENTIITDKQKANIFDRIFGIFPSLIYIFYYNKKQRYQEYDYERHITCNAVILPMLSCGVDAKTDLYCMLEIVANICRLVNPLNVFF